MVLDGWPLYDCSPLVKLLRNELVRLRSTSGTHAPAHLVFVGIERSDQRIVNPGADEELQPNDRLLLLGSPEQLDAGVRLLAAKNG